MGIIGNSIKREVGKNTGKFISNLVFGDKHSTPYRRVGSTSTPRPRQYVEREHVEPRPPRISKVDLRHAELMEQLEAENRLKERMYNEQQENQKKQLQREFIQQVQRNIKNALDFSFHDSNTQEDLNELISILEIKTWNTKENNDWIDSSEKNKNRLKIVLLIFI